MRSILRSLLPLALVLAVAGCKKEKDANEKRVVILVTTDEHSNLYASSPELDDLLGSTSTTLQGGVLRRMTVLQQQRDAAKAAGKATLTLSSGDFSQGSLASAAWLGAAPELATMKIMGYDAVALGNHEFDLGDAALAGMIGNAVQSGTALPPLVLSNLDTTKATALAQLYGAGRPIAPHLVLTASNGIKIGVVSSMGVGAGTVAGAAPANSFWPSTATTTTAKFGAVAAQLQAAVDAVRGEGVDAVVLLGHGGISADPSKPGEDELLALQLEGVDLVLSGHSHLNTPQPRIMYGSGTAVPVVQPKPYGHQVGKVELVFRDDGEAPRPYLDPNATQFFEIDGSVAQSTEAALVDALQLRTIGFLEYGLDGKDSTAAPSFLEATLSRITGSTVLADAAHPGALWNRPLGRLDYTVVGMAPGETNAMNLDTDAMLDAVRQAALIGIPPGACAACAAAEVAIQASGPIRGDLTPSSVDTTSLFGFDKALSFADVYHVVPLGGDPTAQQPADMSPVTNLAGVQAYLNAVPGYPYVLVGIPTAALKAALEGTISTGLFLNGDFFPGVSGLDVEWGLQADPANPVVVKYMALTGGQVLYDAADATLAGTGGYAVSPTAPRLVATTMYIAGVAQGLGIPIFSVGGTALTTPTQLATAVVRRGDGTSIKEFEALAQFIAAQCAGNSGILPATYGAAVPRRVVCTGPGCPPGY